MTSSSAILPPGTRVLYKDRYFPAEEGRVTSQTDHYIYVNFGRGDTSAACNAENLTVLPSLTVGDYTLTRREDGKFWIEHSSGEGMVCSEKNLATAIARLFGKEF